MTVLMVGAVCGATVALLLAWKRRTARTAADEADLDARSHDMVAEGAPDGALATEPR
jgi:hypothetical protein